MERVRGTCVAVDGTGVLLRGRSGTGKSDLALRLIDAGAALVADDYTLVAVENGRPMATAPPELRGLLEVRGIGIVRLPAAEQAFLHVVIELSDPATIERMPAQENVRISGVTLPLFRIPAGQASSAAKVRLVARMAAGSIMRLP
jgi:HPr kinase/phosphorylase